MADNDVTVQFGAKVDELNAGIEHAKEKIESLKEAADKITEGFTKIGELLGVAFSLEAVKEFILSMAELGEQVERMSMILGTSVEFIMQLRGVAQLSGTSVDGLAMSLERMSLQIQRSTRDGTNPAAQSLKLLGLNAKEFIAANTEEKFNLLAEAVSKFNPSMNLTNALMQVGGRGISQLIPALMKAGEGFKELQHEIDEANGAIAKQIPGMAESNEKINLLRITTQSLGASIFTVFKPAIDGTVKTLTDLVRTMRDSVDQGGAFGKIMEGLAFLAKGLATAIASVVSAFQALLILAEAGFKLLTFQSTVKDIDEMGEALLRTGENWKKTFDLIWKGAQELHKTDATPKLDAGQINMMARNQLDANMKLIEGQIEQWKSYYEKLKIFDKSQVDLSKMTEGEMTKDLMAANDQKLANTLALYQQELALAGANAAKMQEIRNKMDKAIEDRDKESLKLQTDQLKKAEKEWEGILGSLSSAFTSQLRGILTGTTTWAQAIKNIMLDLVLKIIEEFLKLAVIKPLSGMLASALDAPTEIFAALIKVIKNMFGPLLAGFTSFFSPELGPAAPAAGAAAASGVVATSVAAVALDTGTDYVPRTGLALIHQGEAIIPASENIAGYSGSSGHAFNINLSAVDVQSFNAWLRNGGGGTMLAKMISDILRRNPTLRPSY